jgi:hypothetical protein
MIASSFHVNDADLFNGMAFALGKIERMLIENLEASASGNSGTVSSERLVETVS